MKATNALLGSLLLFTGAVCAQPAESASPQASVRADGFDIAAGPLALLTHLQQPRTQSPVTFSGQISNWVREEHLPTLMAQLDSPQPCGGVMLTESSRLVKQSTVGDEAAFLIQGFRRGRYPPGLNSVAFDEEEKAEIRAWWRTRKPATP